MYTFELQKIQILDVSIKISNIFHLQSIKTYHTPKEHIYIYKDLYSSFKSIKSKKYTVNRPKSYSIFHIKL